MTLYQIGGQRAARQSARPSRTAAGGGGVYALSRSPLMEHAMARALTEARPLFAHIYVENRCHLKCAHCYESETSHPADVSLSLDDYTRIFRQLADMGVLVLTFSGGEPFLRRDFLDIVALARRLRFAVRIYTSGTLIDEEKADRIAALKVSEVHVSVYSHDPALHEMFTQTPKSHAKSVRALRLLSERGVHTVLKSNVTTFNVDHLDALMELAQQLGADYQFDPTVKPRMDGDTRPLEFAVSPEVLQEKVLSRAAFSPAMTAERAQALCDGENPRHEGQAMCSAARNMVSIGADGGVYPCAVFPVAGGNLKTDSFEDIWTRSPLFEKVRRQTFQKMNACPTCEVRASCGPCMAYGVVEHDDLAACNTPSRQLARATHRLAHRVRRAEQKSARGAGLPIVGALDVEPPERSAKVPALSTEL